MKAYISILRGINVGGARPVKMEELVKVYRDLGFSEVRTYIQSGNVVFRGEDRPARELAEEISGAIRMRFALDVPVIVLDKNKLEMILADNPFLPGKESESDKLHITLLAEVPGESALKNLENVNYLPDEFSARGRAVYLYCPDGYGRTKLNNGFFEKKLKVEATTRNLRTLNELLKMCII
jgi:uncharacterized protein (DUF1697 family)